MMIFDMYFTLLTEKKIKILFGERQHYILNIFFQVHVQQMKTIRYIRKQDPKREIQEKQETQNHRKLQIL